MQKRAAITGGTGFIGHALANALLKQGKNVRVLTRAIKANEPVFPNGVELFEGDLTNPGSRLDAFIEDVDVLYHCAGELRDQTRMQKLHVEGTKRLVKLARGKIKHWVQLSSVGVYGNMHKEVINENTPLFPQGPYEKTKALSDQIVLKAAKDNFFTACILRPANVYGMSMPGQSLDKIINAMRKRLFFFIGKPGATVNFIHVTDVVNALILCGQSAGVTVRIYNLSDTQNMELFIQILAENLGKISFIPRIPEAPIRRLSRICCLLFPQFPLNKSRIDTLTSRVSYPSDRIKKELGYDQKVSMEDGLKIYIASVIPPKKRSFQK